MPAREMMAMSDFRAHDGKCTCLVFVDDEVDSILERYERASGTDAAYIDFEDCVDTANNGQRSTLLRSPRRVRLWQGDRAAREGATRVRHVGVR